MRPSLATKLSLAAALLTLVVAALVTSAALAWMGRDLARAMASQQHSFIAGMARRMDLEIGAAQRALAAAAAAVDPALLRDSDRARAFLRERHSLGATFGYGLYLFDAGGRVVAATAEGARPGADYADLDYLRLPLATGRPYVSAPYLSATADFAPVVMFAVPVVDDRGATVGVLTGGMNLLGDNLLTRPSGVRIGETGYLAVITGAGVVVMHTDREKILARYDNAAIATAESPAARVVADYRGVEVLMVRADLRVSGWTLAACYPTAELYEPLRRARRLAWWVLSAGGVGGAVLAWGLARRLTRGLRRLTEAVSRLDPTTADGATARVPVAGRDETATLAEALNALLERLARERRRIRDLGGELAAAEERERRRVARDLHDSALQTLALARMRLGKLTSALPTARQEEMRRIQGLLDDAAHETRGLVMDLCPPILEELGLPAALEWLAERMRARFGLRVELDSTRAEEAAAPRTSASPSPDRAANAPGAGGDGLDAGARAVLFRATNELLHNVAKHAGVETARIALEFTADHVRVRVLDDGVGIEVRRADADPKQGETEGGLGLRAWRERLEQLGGSLRVAGRPGRGTEAVATVPRSMGIAASVPSPREGEEDGDSNSDGR